jgi:hypothetical protein
MDDLAVIHHQHVVADFLRHAEILLDQQDGCAALLHLGKAFDQVDHDGGREAFGRLVDQQQLARLDNGAGDRQHLFLPAGKRTCARQPEAFQRRKEPENPFQARVVERAFARGNDQVFLHGQVENTAMVSGTYPTPRLAMSGVPSFSMRCPASSI